MENNLILIIVIVVLVVFAARYTQSRRDTRQRKLRYGEDGELAAIEEVIGQQPIHLDGDGSQSKTVQLQAGTYKLQYRFPNYVLVKVDLWRGGESETVVVKKGTGAASFTITEDGRYTLDIAPADEQSPWTLDITRLGLPSRQSD